VSAGLLAIVALIYLAVAWDLGIKDQWGMSIAFICYALANIGFIIAITRGES